MFVPACEFSFFPAVVFWNRNLFLNVPFTDHCLHSLSFPIPVITKTFGNDKIVDAINEYYMARENQLLGSQIIQMFENFGVSGWILFIYLFIFILGHPL